MYVRFYCNEMVMGDLTFQLDPRQLEEITTAAGRVSKVYLGRVAACLNGCCGVNTSCSDVHAASQQTSATDARDDIYVPHHTSGLQSDAELSIGNSPKRQLLLGSGDDLETQRSVAGGALERVNGAGGRSVDIGGANVCKAGTGV